MLGCDRQASSQPELWVRPGWSPRKKGLESRAGASAESSFGGAPEISRPPTARESPSHCAWFGHAAMPGRTRSKAARVSFFADAETAKAAGKEAAAASKARRETEKAARVCNRGMTDTSWTIETAR